MKLIVLQVILFLLVLGCSEPNENRREKHDEVPDRIIPSKPCTTLYKGIMNMFKEHQNNVEIHHYLFTETVEKSILLKEEGEVYITFISEGAGYSNSLGWYSYDSSNPPKSSSDLDKKILFPHISDAVLNQGDQLQVGDGKFKAGTVIGFFMIVRGWENGYVNFGKKSHYTDIQFNHNQFQQHVLFKEGNCGDIVLGFEDRPLDQADCDFDFNDIIFTISDNKEQLETVAFNLDKLYVFN